MVGAYRYAENPDRNPLPPVLDFFYRIRYLGYQAAKELPLGMQRNMILSDRIVRAYNGRRVYRDEDGKADWAGWARENPDESELLEEAMTLAFEEGKKNDIDH